MPPVISSGTARRYICFLGIPLFCAASKAVGNKGRHVNKALDPEDLS